MSLGIFGQVPLGSVVAKTEACIKFSLGRLNVPHRFWFHTLSIHWLCAVKAKTG